jgi:hypothetical protein
MPISSELLSTTAAAGSMVSDGLPAANSNTPHISATASTVLACQLAKQDLQAVRKEYLFGLPSSWTTRLAQLLRDERDVPLALAFMNMLLMTLPAAVLLHVFKVQSHAVGLGYVLISYALFLQVGGSRVVGSI